VSFTRRQLCHRGCHRGMALCSFVTKTWLCHLLLRTCKLLASYEAHCCACLVCSRHQLSHHILLAFFILADGRRQIRSDLAKLRWVIVNEALRTFHVPTKPAPFSGTLPLVWKMAKSAVEAIATLAVRCQKQTWFASALIVSSRADRGGIPLFV